MSLDKYRNMSAARETVTMSRPRNCLNRACAVHEGRPCLEAHTDPRECPNYHREKARSK